MNELAIQRTDEPSIGQLLSAGISSGDVATVRELCELRRQERAEDAKQAFAAAFVRLQAETPSIHARKAVPDNSGGVRYHYAPYEDIMRQVAPLLRKNGFAITFDTEMQDGRAVVTCTLIHEGGHSRSNKFSARTSAPPKCSEAQADGATVTYAKRFALCGALNIVIEEDSDGADARNIGGPISADEVAELRERVSATKADEEKFLRVAGVPTFEQIPQSKLAELRGILARREAKMKEAQ
jgi:hypothetical protein